MCKKHFRWNFSMRNGELGLKLEFRGSFNIIKLSNSGLMPSQKKNVRVHLKRLETVFLFLQPQFLSQVKCEPYHSQTPNFLLSVVDQIIKADNYQVLRHDFLHYSLEQTIYQEEEHPNNIWLYINPSNQLNLISRAPHPLLPTEQPQSLLNGSSSLEGGKGLTCVNALGELLGAQVIETMKQIELVSLDQIRLRCQANVYTSPLVLVEDIFRLVGWHQVFRAYSLKTFLYLSAVYQKIVGILDKKDFYRKFYELKQTDINRLMKEEIGYKLDTQQWPIIPTNFRQYEQIDTYVPSPSNRQDRINSRIISQKKPVECGPDCVCLRQDLPEGQSFCTWSLVNGWETKCPNRLLKIQCQHSNPQDQLKCRNSEIQKQERKKCKKPGDIQGQIEERITWGIDLYTRNVIYHCLPEVDIEGIKDKVSNEQRKNYFIEKTLVKAFNLLGKDGYSIVEVCNFIKNNSEYNVKLEKLKTSQTKVNETIQINNQQWLFSQRDWQYADLLLRNYELAQDKSGFRIHTKGKGAICIDHRGIKEGTFLVEYFGQIYEPWRWYDRQDFIKEVMRKRKVKQHMPQFYNIAMEKHPDEPLGCDMLMVDPSRKGNFSSRFSHSCDPNCGTITTVANGKYYIGMYAFKNIVYGQQLTFDYCSMTESNYEHINSICLCGMKRCRGFYLQLSNTKMFNNLMDNKNCFFTRNSAIIKADHQPTEEQYQMLQKYNIKKGFLQDSPEWLVNWIASVLKFIEEEGEIYQQSLMETWRRDYPWPNPATPEEKEENIQKYSLTSRQELESIRFQNLLTSVDKIKYFYEHNRNNRTPPIFVESHGKVLDVLILKDDSVLKELQDNLIRCKIFDLPRTIETFLTRIESEENPNIKLSLFRLCCLIMCQKLMLLNEAQFNHRLLGDIVYFYAFTHTYFSPNQFMSFDAEQINISISQILGEKSPPNQRREKSSKKYSSPFVWGQMASWFKQTIVCPEASLSQDRRGTLSYPLIRSIMRSEYPYERQSRSYFLKMIRQKPANSWPPARACDLSFKNPYKLYGTVLFQNVHSREKLAERLPKDTLLESCLEVINAPLRQKLELFKQVELILGGIPLDSSIYDLVEEGDLDKQIPTRPENSSPQNEPRKKVKRGSSDSP